MPKRNTEDKLDFIYKKMKKLEKEVKKSRREKRRRTLSASSSSSQSSSSNSSTCSSRCGSIPPENRNTEETTTHDAHVIDDSPPAPAIDSEPHESPQDPIIQEEIVNSSELLDILGTDPSITVEYGPEINKEVANRFEYISSNGLNKEARKELLDKYLIPANCKNIDAPQLNPEIKAAATEQAIKRDKAIEFKQKQISAGISCLGKIISNQLNLSEKNHDLVKDLMDVGRILCDVQHMESSTRRNFALYSVKKDMKDQLTTTKIDKFLFGQDLPETLKAAKAVSKSSTDLKMEIPKKPLNRQPAANPAPFQSTANKALNWKAGTSTRRQPPRLPPRHQPPAVQHRGNSSRNYTHRPRQSHRR